MHNFLSIFETHISYNSHASSTMDKTFVFLSTSLQAYYITSARELARMVGIHKAPILHHFSESVSGAATIHCFNQEDRFLTKILSLIDDYSRVAFYNSATMEWLCVRINFLFNLVFFLVLIILVGLPRSAINPSKFFLSLLFLPSSSYICHCLKLLQLTPFNVNGELMHWLIYLRLGRTGSYLWSEPKCSSSLGYMEYVQC